MGDPGDGRPWEWGANTKILRNFIIFFHYKFHSTSLLLAIVIIYNEYHYGLFGLDNQCVRYSIPTRCLDVDEQNITTSVPKLRTDTKITGDVPCMSKSWVGHVPPILPRLLCRCLVPKCSVSITIIMGLEPVAE